jgi:hypothetical protein
MDRLPAYAGQAQKAVHRAYCLGDYCAPRRDRRRPGDTGTINEAREADSDHFILPTSERQMFPIWFANFASKPERSNRLCKPKLGVYYTVTIRPISVFLTERYDVPYNYQNCTHIAVLQKLRQIANRGR